MADGCVGSAEVESLGSAQRSRLLVAMKALREVLPVATAESQRHVEHIDALWEQLANLQKQAPHAMEAVLRDPATAGGCFRLLRAASTADISERRTAHHLRIVGDFLASLVVAAAMRAGDQVDLTAVAVDGQTWLPSLGVVVGPWQRPRCAVGVRSTTGGWQVTGPGARTLIPYDVTQATSSWLPLWRMTTGEADDGMQLTVDAVSPYRDFREPRAATPLAPESVRHWARILRETWRIVVNCAPAEAATVAGMVRSLVPLPGPARRQMSSASTSDAFGQVLLSPPTDPLDLAATLVHEARHQQLNSVMLLTSLCEKDPASKAEAERYFAPWRGDPRPLMGLLHGAYAFGGMARFWLGAAKHGPAAGRESAWFEFALSTRQLRQALAGLNMAAGLTPPGRRIVDGLASMLRDWQKATTPRHLDQLAAWRTADRWATWRVRHMALPQDSVDALVDAWRRRIAPGPLPSARLEPRLSEVQPDVRTSLVRLKLRDPQAFTEVAQQVRHGLIWPELPTATAGDAAAVTGDLPDAAERYRRALQVDAADTSAWTGLALSLARERGCGPQPWVRLLVERPEAVRALQGALARSGHLVEPEPLARWLAWSAIR